MVYRRDNIFRNYYISVKCKLIQGNLVRLVLNALINQDMFMTGMNNTMRTKNSSRIDCVT